MCLSNESQIPEEKGITLHCRECGRIVSLDEASIYCYGAGHEIAEAKDELFARQP